MGTALGTALVLFALGVLIYPFFRRSRYALPVDPAVERLRAARLRVYRQIADLEADYRAGELSNADHDAQLHDLRLTAARLMKQETEAGAAEDDLQRLEREIQAARAARSTAGEGGDET